ncbi:MAG: hypothetical protein AVDCRST_MAG40-2474, partial [uncultured Gemmatimonadaceae bacterium]
MFATATARRAAVVAAALLGAA